MLIILLVTYNSRLKEFAVLDSTGIVTWQANENVHNGKFFNIAIKIFIVFDIFQFKITKNDATFDRTFSAIQFLISFCYHKLHFVKCLIRRYQSSSLREIQSSTL